MTHKETSELSLGFGIWFCGRLIHWYKTEAEMTTQLKKLEGELGQVYRRL
jgi:hypothetical protein